MSIAHVNRILRISRNVTELARSVLFYQERLGFKPSGPPFVMDDGLAQLCGFTDRAMIVQRLRLGPQELELVETGRNVRSYPENSTSADLWFQHFAVCSNDCMRAFQQLYRADSAAILPMSISRDEMGDANPIKLPARSGGVTAFKFRDPDGHPVELLEPAHTGPTRRTQEGIDHCAISVADIGASIDFYIDKLGFSMSARQTNFGQEQGCLDGLDEPVLEVIALRTSPSLSPHLELLGYRRPVGAAQLVAASPADIVSDKLVLAISSPREVASQLEASSQIGSIAREEVLLVRDPDGHLLILTG